MTDAPERMVSLIEQVACDAGGKRIATHTARRIAEELLVDGYIHQDLATQERDEAWNEAIEAAAQWLEPKNDPDDWTDYARDCDRHAQNVRNLKKPTGDKADD